MSISVDCWSQSIVDLSPLLISVACLSQLLVDLSWLSISVDCLSQLIVDLSLSSLLISHTSKNQILHKTNWLETLVYYILTPATVGTIPNIQPNHRVQVFEKIHFFIFRSPKIQLLTSWRGPKDFFGPHYLIWLLNLWL